MKRKSKKKNCYPTWSSLQVLKVSQSTLGNLGFLILLNFIAQNEPLSSSIEFNYKKLPWYRNYKIKCQYVHSSYVRSDTIKNQTKVSSKTLILLHQTLTSDSFIASVLCLWCFYIFPLLFNLLILITLAPSFFTYRVTLHCLCQVEKNNKHTFISKVLLCLERVQ